MGRFQFQLLLGLNRSKTVYWGVASDVRFVLGLLFNYFEWKPDVTVAFFFHFHIIGLILRRGMGLVRDAEFGGNSAIWSSSFSTWECRYFGCSGPPWAHVLDFNLAHVRLFQTPDFCKAWVFPGGWGSLFFSACVGSRPASNFYPQKYQEFQAPKKYFSEPTYIWKYQIPPPPPPLGSVLG